MSVARFISKRRSQGTSQVSRQIKMTTERLMTSCVRMKCNGVKSSTAVNEGTRSQSEADE